MKEIGLRGALQRLSCKVLSLKWDGGITCRNQSGFFMGNGENGFEKDQLYFIRYFPDNARPVAYHKAKDLKDRDASFLDTRYDFESKLVDVGYRLDRKTFYGRSW